jgi:tRNA G18 (ribose-2'-O)-methylase SpoU
MGLAVEPKAVDCRDVQFPSDDQTTHTILVVGNEGFGLRPLVCISSLNPFIMEPFVH